MLDRKENLFPTMLGYLIAVWVVSLGCDSPDSHVGSDHSLNEVQNDNDSQSLDRPSTEKTNLADSPNQPEVNQPDLNETVSKALNQPGQNKEVGSLEDDTKASPNSKIQNSEELSSVELLLIASFNGDADKVQQLLEKYSEQINSRDPESRTGLMLASFNGHLDIVNLLLDAKADVNLKDRFGRTALMYAATGTNLKVVELLIQKDAEVNSVDEVQNWSPLMFAASEGQIRTVQILLENGADKDAKDIDGESSIDFARSKGHADVVWLLTNFDKKSQDPPK